MAAMRRVMRSTRGRLPGSMSHCRETRGREGGGEGGEEGFGAYVDSEVEEGRRGGEVGEEGVGEGWPGM